MTTKSVFLFHYSLPAFPKFIALKMYENYRRKQIKITNHLQPHQKANEGLQQLHHPTRHCYLFELSRYVEATGHGMNITVSNFVNVNNGGAINYHYGVGSMGREIGKLNGSCRARTTKS